jgi:hypothetical protein
VNDETVKKLDDPAHLSEELRQLAADSRDTKAAEEAMAAAKPKVKKLPFDKREFFEALLPQAESLRLLIDGGAFGVVLPPDLCVSKLIALHYGQNIPHPPKDLAVDEWGVRATLTFTTGEQMAAVPWDAVVQVSDMEHFLWEDRRRIMEFQNEEQKHLPPKYTKRGKAVRRHLRAVH